MFNSNTFNALTSYDHDKNLKIDCDVETSIPSSNTVKILTPSFLPLTCYHI